MNDIFTSYSRRDTAIVEKFVTAADTGWLENLDRPRRYPGGEFMARTDRRGN